MILTIINTQVGGGVAAEAEQALNNIGNILAAAGGGWKNCFVIFLCFPFLHHWVLVTFALVFLVKELCSLHISSLLWLMKMKFYICNINLSMSSRIQGCDKDNSPDEGHQQIFRGERILVWLRINLNFRWTEFMGGSSQITSQREPLFRFGKNLKFSPTLCISTWTSQLIVFYKQSFCSPVFFFT